MSGPPTPTGAANLAELTKGLEQAFDLIAMLRGQIEAIVDELQARRASNNVTAIRWADLDADAARQTWNALYDWVTWLLDRYTVREVPRACWWRHGLIVEELTALWLAWQGAFGEDTTAIAPTFWHEHLDRARDRMRLRLQQQGNCAAGGHQPFGPQPHPPEVRDEFTAFVNGDAAHRTNAPPVGTGRYALPIPRIT
jgi:uncharacterized protein DUF4913